MVEARAAPRLENGVWLFVQLDQHATARRPQALGRALEAEYVAVKSGRLLSIANAESYLANMRIRRKRYPVILPLSRAGHGDTETRSWISLRFRYP